MRGRGWLLLLLLGLLLLGLLWDPRPAGPLLRVWRCKALLLLLGVLLLRPGWRQRLLEAWARCLSLLLPRLLLRLLPLLLPLGLRLG